MAKYIRINRNARIFTHPTTKIKSDDLQKLMDESKEEKLPETVRSPRLYQYSAVKAK